MSIWRWSQWLDAPPDACRVTLGEGGTPLIRSRRIGPSLGAAHLFFKLETANPSGSYKDRFAAAAISHMRAAGQTVCVATSSGNTGAALASYCAAAGIACDIAIVETAPAGKLRQMQAYGADIYRIKGFGLDEDISRRVFAFLRDKGRRPGHALQISAFCMSPLGMQGVQTLAYELAGAEALADMGGPADHVFCPAGGGGLTLAVARGLETARERGATSQVTAVHCVQPAGNDTMAGALRAGRDHGQAVTCTSRISGLQVPSVLDGDAVIAACRRSGGTGHAVSDERVWEMQARLAREEGVFCEPAGACALAGVADALARGDIDPGDRIVALVTGSGFKDEPSLDRMLRDKTCPLLELGEVMGE